MYLGSIYVHRGIETKREEERNCFGLSQFVIYSLGSEKEKMNWINATTIINKNKERATMTMCR